MKNVLGFTVLIFLFVSCIQATAQMPVNEGSKSKTKKWFKKKEWLGGAKLTPHKSIDKKEFARQYHLNKLFWDRAFAFLKEHNLDSLPKGKYIIDGDNVTASVTEDPSKDIDKTNWESHRKFADIQCIISGEEKMGIYPVSKATITKTYDEKRDAANYSAKGKFYVGGPGVFFIFFPSDAHRPNITPGGNKVVKKIVIKVRVVERLQYLVFPEGILYSKQKNRVRARRVNEIFAAIEPLAKDLEENKKGNLKKDCLKPHSVPITSQSSNFLGSDLNEILEF